MQPPNGGINAAMIRACYTKEPCTLNYPARLPESVEVHDKVPP